MYVASTRAEGTSGVVTEIFAENADAPIKGQDTENRLVIMKLFSKEGNWLGTGSWVCANGVRTRRRTKVSKTRKCRRLLASTSWHPLVARQVCCGCLRRSKLNTRSSLLPAELMGWLWSGELLKNKLLVVGWTVEISSTRKWERAHY